MSLPYGPTVEGLQDFGPRRKQIVEPLGLVLKAGAWHLVARYRKETAIYRLASVHAARTLERLRAATELRSREEVARFEASLRRTTIDIRFASSALSRVDRLGADAAEAMRAAPPDAQGWRYTSIRIEGVAHAAALLLGFGSEVEVIAPAALRTELAKRATAVCALYA